MQDVAPELLVSRMVYLQDTDETGLWVRVRREDGEHFVLVLWEFMLSLDIPAGETKTLGLRP